MVENGWRPCFGLNGAVMEMIRILGRLQQDFWMIGRDSSRSVHDCPCAAKIGGHYDPKKVTKPSQMCVAYE